MEISIFGLSYIRISVDCFITDDCNVFIVDPTYAEVDLINLGNSLVVVTKNLPKHANQIALDLVRNEDVLSGERYYAIIN